MIRCRLLTRAVTVTVAAVALLAALPVTIVAVAGVGVAWQRGWQAARLYRAAGWCAPMLMAWLASTAIADRSATAVAGAPYAAWLAMWQHGAAGNYLAAAVDIAPAAVPAGLIAAGWAWSWRIRSMAARAGGRSPESAVAFDQRQWRHQVRSARARIATPGSVPLLTASGDFVVGAVIRAVGHPDQPLARFPSERLRAHQIVIGGTGTGNTTPVPLLTTRVPRLYSPICAG
jgi:hypothetical protein